MRVRRSYNMSDYWLIRWDDPWVVISCRSVWAYYGVLVLWAFSLTAVTYWGTHTVVFNNICFFPSSFSSFSFSSSGIAIIEFLSAYCYSRVLTIPVWWLTWRGWAYHLLKTTKKPTSNNEKIFWVLANNMFYVFLWRYHGIPNLFPFFIFFIF